MKPPPQLIIGTTDTHYGIHGWEDFDRYARCNWALYSSMTKAYAYMTEVDRLRLMLAMYAAGYAELQLQLSKDLLPGQVPRFIGP